MELACCQLPTEKACSQINFSCEEVSTRISYMKGSWGRINELKEDEWQAGYMSVDLMLLETAQVWTIAHYPEIQVYWKTGLVDI